MLLCVYWQLFANMLAKTNFIQYSMWWLYICLSTCFNVFLPPGGQESVNAALNYRTHTHKIEWEKMGLRNIIIIILTDAGYEETHTSDVFLFVKGFSNLFLLPSRQQLVS